MAFTIEKVNIDDEQVDTELRHLIQVAFNEASLLKPGRLAANIKSNASKASFFLAAKQGNKIVGCNAFLANDFTLNNIPYVGYQSCWSAIHPAYQGNGIFVSLISEAKKMLTEQGAGFIYGLANNKSHNILINKLDFKEIPFLAKRILNLPLLKGKQASDVSIDNIDVCLVNEQQILAHKVLQFPAEVKKISYNNSWIWGKVVRKTKYGINIPVFYVGGVTLKKETDLNHLITKIFSEFKVLFIQMLSCGTHTLNPLFTGWKPSKMNPFVFYNLNMPAAKHFDIMFGAIDIF